MSWDSIIGQERVKDILQRAIIENKVSHSYCFWGVEGCGKDALAIEFAKALNCTNPTTDKATKYEACDECDSCRAMKSLQSANLQLIFSLPTPKTTSAKEEGVLAKMSAEQMNEINAQIKLKAENPYHKITLAGANQIKIASIRELKKKLSLSGSVGRRVIIISNADEITTEASNAFLKTLEEPQENITIIQTTAKIDKIMPTILSRSQQIHCEPISDENIVNMLVNKMGKSQAEASIIASFAQGSYYRALEFMEDDLQDLRESVVNAFRAIIKNKYRIELLDNLEELFKVKDKKKIEKYLVLLMLWLRDAMILHNVGDSSLIINADYVDTLTKFVQHFGHKDIPLAIEKIEFAISRIYGNVMTELLLLDLFLDLRHIFRQVV